MGLDHSNGRISPGFPRLLIVQKKIANAESLVRTFEDRRLDVDFDLTSSHHSALRNLLASPYHVIISDAHLAQQDDWVLLNHTQTLQPSVPVIVTASAPEKEVARRVLKQGAFDLITHPLDHEQAVSAILLALWQSKLVNLIACKEKALEKYHEHVKACPWGSEMEAIFKRTLSAIEASIRTYEKTMWQVEDRPLGLSNIAKAVEVYAKQQALERLHKLSK